MKKLIFPIVCCFISVTVSAQLIKPKAETQKKQSELDWFNCSFDQDSVYGAEVNKAYDYLKANKKKAPSMLLFYRRHLKNLYEG